MRKKVESLVIEKNTYLYTMNYVQTYDIAEWQIAICADSEAVCDELLPSFSVFKTEIGVPAIDDNDSRSDID